MTAPLAELVEHFAAERGQDVTGVSPSRHRALLAALLTTRPPGPVPAPVTAALDDLLAREAGARETVSAADLARVGDQVPGLTGPLARTSEWQGDITTLVVDAIVNAANAQLLGCFVPEHRCIDNVIHAVAGPALRAECAELMQAQGHPEPTGHAKITGGYHLPARWVVHTVGPIVPDHQPTIEHASLLASSYRACLQVAHDAGAASLAFCGISTGVFGYPVELAAAVALRAVEAWLTEHPETDLHVVFNTFSSRDTDAYLTTLAERHR